MKFPKDIFPKIMCTEILKTVMKIALALPVILKI